LLLKGEANQENALTFAAIIELPFLAFDAIVANHLPFSGS
jgi:hypothetical protein